MESFKDYNGNHSTTHSSMNLVYWSALATAPAPAETLAEAKEAFDINKSSS
jgi:hypothetical protein